MSTTHEYGLLANLMADPVKSCAAIDEIGLLPSDCPTIEPIVSVCLDLNERSTDINVNTVADELKRRGQYDDIGGMTFLTSEEVSKSLDGDARYHAVELKKASLQRRMPALASDLSSQSAVSELALTSAKLDALNRGDSRTSDQLVIHDAFDFLNLKIQPPRYLLEPILRECELAMVFSPRGTGKTLFQLGLAYSVASGTPFLRWFSPNQYKVLIVDGELTTPVLQGHLKTVIRASGIPASEEALRNIRVLNYDLQKHGVPNIADPVGQRRIEAEIRDEKLLILDSLSTLCRSGEENSNSDWSVVQEWLLTLRRRGVAVLLLHHAGVNGRARGASKKEDVLDLILSLRQPDGYDAAQGARFVVEFKKSRSVYGQAVAPFEASLIVDAHGDPCWSVQGLASCLEARVRELQGDGLTASEISKELGKNRGTIHKIIKRLEGGVQ